MRLRVLLVALALVVLAVAGLRQADHASNEPSTTGTASSQLSAQPAPAPSLPAVVVGAVKPSTSSPTSLPSGWHRHLRLTMVVIVATRHARCADTAADRPRTFPLLI